MASGTATTRRKKRTLVFRTNHGAKYGSGDQMMPWVVGWSPLRQSDTGAAFVSAARVALSIVNHSEDLVPLRLRFYIGREMRTATLIRSRRPATPRALQCREGGSPRWERLSFSFSLGGKSGGQDERAAGSAVHRGADRVVCMRGAPVLLVFGPCPVGSHSPLELIRLLQASSTPTIIRTRH